MVTLLPTNTFCPNETFFPITAPPQTCAQCHRAESEAVVRSTMAHTAGEVSVARYRAGKQPTPEPEVAGIAVIDPTPDDSNECAVGRLSLFAPPPIDPGSSDPAALSRAIYDWVVDNVEYKKTGTGWGNGDTFWACNERYGNCTDFHALFVSLARSEGIPARFEIGFPVPMNRAAGDIGGYRCWVQFYLPERGWVPIDASEAAKHPERRELFYGSHPADRIHFSTGRDLVVSAASEARPLNYFIYPYVEIGGKPWPGKM